MKLDTEFSRESTDADEIGDFLQLAFLQKWQFSCMQMIRNHLSSEEVTVLDVNVFDHNFIVDSEVLTVATQEAHSVTFRAQSGGLTLLFNAAPKPSNLDPSVCECKFEFPRKLRFTQLRKAVRINFRNKPEVKVNLFAREGGRFDGQLMDLSTTGAKIQLLGDLRNQLEPAQPIDDCQLLLPDGELLDLRALIRGIAYDRERGVSVLRCEFEGLSGEDVIQLQSLINEATHSTDEVELALVS